MWETYTLVGGEIACMPLEERMLIGMPACLACRHFVGVRINGEDDIWLLSAWVCRAGWPNLAHNFPQGLTHGFAVCEGVGLIIHLEPVNVSAEAVGERRWGSGRVEGEAEDYGAVVAVALGEHSRFGVIAPDPLGFEVGHRGKMPRRFKCNG